MLRTLGGLLPSNTVLVASGTALDGEPHQVDADRVLRNIPQFKRDVDVRGKTQAENG
ncbi:hypothetical protein AB0L06_19850 [Spirillospora sp. NPDC052269]